MKRNSRSKNSTVNKCSCCTTDSSKEDNPPTIKRRKTTTNVDGSQREAPILGTEPVAGPSTTTSAGLQNLDDITRRLLSQSVQTPQPAFLGPSGTIPDREEDSSSSSSESSEDEDLHPNTLPQGFIAGHCNTLMEPGQEIPFVSSKHGQRPYGGSRTSTCTGLDRTVLHLLNTSLAPSTTLSYKNALKHYANFHYTYYPNLPLLPASVEQVATFIALSYHRHLQASTITSYVSAIAYIHKIQSLPNPTEHFVIKKLLYSARRNKSSDKRRPFTLDNLHNMLTVLPSIVHTKYFIKLFKAMFLTAFFGLFRVGEIALAPQAPRNVIQYDSVKFHYKHSKLKAVHILVKQFKHSQGKTVNIPLQRQKRRFLCPVRSLLRYTVMASPNKGSFFQDQMGEPIKSSHFRTVLRSCVLACNLDPSHFTGHSFRIGGATLAHSMHMAPNQIKRLGRWKSDAYLKYIRTQALPTNPIL